MHHHNHNSCGGLSPPLLTCNDFVNQRGAPVAKERGDQRCECQSTCPEELGIRTNWLVAQGPSTNLLPVQCLELVESAQGHIPQNPIQQLLKQLDPNRGRPAYARSSSVSHSPTPQHQMRWMNCHPLHHHQVHRQGCTMHPNILCLHLRLHTLRKYLPWR